MNAKRLEAVWHLAHPAFCLFSKELVRSNKMAGRYLGPMPPRRTLEFSHTGQVDFSALKNEPVFLYRGISDQDRAVLGIGVHKVLQQPEFGADGRVDDWVFGAVRYEWMSTSPFVPAHDEALSFWFVPRFVVEWTGNVVRIHVLDGDEVEAGEWAAALLRTPRVVHVADPLTWTEQCSREHYLENVRRLLAHIQRGDIYEVNYCTERTSSAPGFHPYAAFQRLLDRSKAPFPAFFRNGDELALCASPERFLAINDDNVIGQPMKGTRPRSSDAIEDARLAHELSADHKERSENIMALDVMRHDLSRVAASRSVVVDELCAVRSFPNVHQMISTVSATLRTGCSPFDAVQAAFPMASMTGAPKIRAMELIRETEGRSRGLFSGSLGFFAPDGCGDLNVVIRTVLYDERTSSLSLTTGSAITASCDPDREWEECQLKARSVMDALGS